MATSDQHPPGPGKDGQAWHDFGQRVDLTARIREVLLNYPEGTSILKESIQNADDARASVVRFCLDRRQHATGAFQFMRLPCAGKRQGLLARCFQVDRSQGTLELVVVNQLVCMVG